MIWMQTPIDELGDKRLWNIVVAMEKGTWAGGRRCDITGEMRDALHQEYWKRCDRGTYSAHNVDEIKGANEEWERKNAGGEPLTTPKSCGHSWRPMLLALWISLAVATPFAAAACVAWALR